MNDLKTDSRPFFDASGSRIKLALYLAPVVLVVIFAVWLFWPSGGTAAAANPEQVKSELAARHDLTRDIQDLQVKLDAMDTVSNEFANKEALLGARSAEAQTLHDSTAMLIAQLSGERAAWSQRIQPLLDNEAGRRLAANDAVVTRVQANWLPDTYMTDPAFEPERFTTRLEKLAKSSHPSPAVIELYKALRDDLQQALTFIQQRRKGIEGLVATSTAAAPANRTLRVAIDDIRKHKDAEHAARIAEMLEDAESERVASMGELEAELYRKQTEKLKADKRREIALADKEAELVREKQQQDLQLADTKAELARVAAKRKQDLLESQARRDELKAAMQNDLREIKSVLTPFITPGYTSFGGDRWFTRTEKRPMSFSAIVSFGALDDSMEGIHKMCTIAAGGGTHNSTRGDRPIWRGYYEPSLPLSPRLNGERIEFIKRAQTLLRKYGSLMVEEGMLSP